MNRNTNSGPKGFLQLAAEVLKRLAKISRTTILMMLTFAFAFYSITKVTAITGVIGVAIANSNPALAIEILNDFGYLVFAQMAKVAFQLLYNIKHMMHELHEANHEIRKLKLLAIQLWWHIKKWLGK